MSEKIKEKLWGVSQLLLDDDNCKVKKIIVSPKKRISYQSHKQRAELWIIISGEGLMTQNNKTYPVRHAAIVMIPFDSKYRVENTHDTEDLVIIETQVGAYFGEDDIIRFDDDWGRHRDNWNNVDDDLE